MRVLGIDLAARPKNTDACLLEWTNGVLLAELHRGCDDARLFMLAEGCRKVAIDAPFGWPNEFIDALAAHRAGEPWPAADDGRPDEFRASLSFRETDRVVMHTRRPLSVSTNLLGVTAMRCAYLLHRWSAHEAIHRTGRGRFVEVYPAAALVRWGFEGAGYKGANRKVLAKLLSNLCNSLPALKLDATTRKACATNDDAFDALVAALVARAVILGLTEGPPRKMRERAEQEGWIHLPVRGSFPFLGRARADLGGCPLPALAEKLRGTGVRVDGKGYVRQIEDVLLPTISNSTRNAIKSDLGGKGGSELIRRRKRAPKFYAAHSSAALAANTFGPFLREHEGVPMLNRTLTGTTALEAECPTGLRGTPPTLDFLVEGVEILAVESKCIETFAAHMACFKDAYTEAMAKVHETWREEYLRLVEDPLRYRFLDAAQLVKHYLGLRSTYHDRTVTLAYLYWVPTNAGELAPCAVHVAEVEEFATRVRDPMVRFVPMSYSALWTEWSLPKQPAWLKTHVKALRMRYEAAA